VPKSKFESEAHVVCSINRCTLNIHTHTIYYARTPDIAKKESIVLITEGYF